MVSLGATCNPFATDYAINHALDHELSIDYGLEQNYSNIAIEKEMLEATN